MAQSLAVQPNTLKIRKDPIPMIRSAGKVIATGGHNADMCIRSNLFQNEYEGNGGTPPHSKKFRRSTAQEVGLKQIHPGMQGDVQAVPQNHSYGRKVEKLEGVDGVIKSQNLNGFAERSNDVLEGKYASATREPLGGGYKRGYQWPGAAEEGAIAFGVATTGLDNAKELLYTKGGSFEERPEVTKMYVKTHGNYGPGEQRTREYDWVSNPRVAGGSGQTQAHAFGYGEERLVNGAMKAVMPEREAESFPKTVIVKKTVEDAKAVQSDMLGTVKNLGQGQPDRAHGHTYGSVSNVDGIWNAGKCIQGEPSHKELQPDKDLGVSVRANCSNTVRHPDHVNKTFGTPSIRTDIPYKNRKSMADYQNYGDEPEAIDLLAPATFTECGISEYDFQVPRSREQVKALFEKIGHSYKIGKFNCIFNRAIEMCNSTDEMVSVRAFMMAVNALHHVE